MASGQQERKRVLVVDDCLATQEMLTIILEVEGYEVTCARDGQEALRLLGSATPPDVILLDLMMPVVSGWDFLQRRKQDPRLQSIPVVVLSALGDGAPDLASLGAAACI